MKRADPTNHLCDFRIFSHLPSTSKNINLRMMTFTSSPADTTPTPAGRFRPVGTAGRVCRVWDASCPVYFYKDGSGYYTKKDVSGQNVWEVLD